MPMASTEIVIQPKARPLSPKQARDRLDRRLMFLAIALIFAAWIYGYVTNGTDVVPLVKDVLPGTTEVKIEGQLFIGLDAEGGVVGYAAAGEAPGYGGPIVMLVGVDPAGNVIGTQIVEHRESPGFFRLLISQGLMEEFPERSVTDSWQLGQGIDAVSGATISSEGIAAATRQAIRTIATDGLNVSLPPEKQSIKFGAPEIALLALYGFGYVGHKLRSQVWKRRVRWSTLLGGLIILGFIYTAPLTITMVISLLSGYWPDWHNNLYWYLLIGGILFVTTVDAKNPYCSWFCPFGAFQECLATLSGAKHYRPRELDVPLKWVQRGLALAAIVLGLALRRPGVASYEPFATLFDFRGATASWVLLILVTLTSLVMYRPFCHYLCPLDPVVDFVAAARRWVKEGWAKWRPQTPTQKA